MSRRKTTWWDNDKDANKTKGRLTSAPQHELCYRTCTVVRAVLVVVCGGVVRHGSARSLPDSIFSRKNCHGGAGLFRMTFSDHRGLDYSPKALGPRAAHGMGSRRLQKKRSQQKWCAATCGRACSPRWSFERVSRRKDGRQEGRKSSPARERAAQKYAP
jgi:hypothetical protein